MFPFDRRNFLKLASKPKLEYFDVLFIIYSRTVENSETIKCAKINTTAVCPGFNVMTNGHT